MCAIISAIRYPLSAIRYPLSAIRYPLSAIRYPLSVNYNRNYYLIPLFFVLILCLSVCFSNGSNGKISGVPISGIAANNAVAAIAHINSAGKKETHTLLIDAASINTAPKTLNYANRRLSVIGDDPTGMRQPATDRFLTLVASGQNNISLEFHTKPARHNPWLKPYMRF